MQEERLRAVRGALEEERKRVLQHIEEIERGNLDVPLTRAIHDLSSYDNHPADQGSETFEREKDIALRENARIILHKIEDALSRIDEGKYGICERCGKIIDEARLEAIPYTTLCLHCKEEEEKDLDSSRRPVEEDLLDPPFGRSDLDETSELMYDGEDTWQDVARYGTSESPQDVPPAKDPRKAYIESDEDRGIVEDVEGVLDDGEDADLPESPGKK